MTTARAGIDRSQFDDSIRPQDDLFGHVNGRWIAETPIPSYFASYGTFEILFEEAEANVRAIIEECVHAEPGSEARKVGDLYSSFLDQAAVDARGAEPIRPLLDRVGEVSSVEEFFALLGELERGPVGGFFHLYVDIDDGDPDRYRLVVSQGGLSLPDESFYREDHFAEIRAAYAAHVARMFSLVDLPGVEFRASRVLGLETALAAHHWDRVATRDALKRYNPATWEDLVEKFASSHPGDGARLLATWRAALDVPNHTFDALVLAQPSFVEEVGALFTEESLDGWCDWLRWKIIHGYAPYLSAPFVDENFAFYSRTLSGTEELRERWKRAVGFAQGAMGEAVGRLYVERHFPPSAKVAMDHLVENLLDAYRESISELGWMGEETRSRALEKLDQFTPKIGYPVKWRDYSSLEVVPDDLVANVNSVVAFAIAYDLAKLAGPVDRTEWLMTPQTVNAYYQPSANEIVFPAAILQPPFFDEDRDPAANYGAIGAVIGHEIGHGFDDQGSRYDGRGRLSDWWNDEDREAFDALTQRLIDQYEGRHTRFTDERAVNGALTVGENIGDLGGLGIAWKAYLLSLEGDAPPEVEGLSAAQRFLYAWAIAWRGVERSEAASRQIEVDPHSPRDLRCNQIVRNLPVFYDAFGVGPDDGAWLAPEERVEIW